MTDFLKHDVFERENEVFWHFDGCLLLGWLEIVDCRRVSYDGEEAEGEVNLLQKTRKSAAMNVIHRRRC